MVAIAGVLISLLVLIAGLLPSYLEARFSTLTNPFSAESGNWLSYIEFTYGNR